MEIFVVILFVASLLIVFWFFGKKGLEKRDNIGPVSPVATAAFKLGETTMLLKNDDGTWTMSAGDCEVVEDTPEQAYQALLSKKEKK